MGPHCELNDDKLEKWFGGAIWPYEYLLFFPTSSHSRFPLNQSLRYCSSPISPHGVSLKGEESLPFEHLWTKHFLDLDGTFRDHALILGQLYWYCACHTELSDGRRCDRFDVVSKEFSHQNTTDFPSARIDQRWPDSLDTLDTLDLDNLTGVFVILNGKNEIKWYSFFVWKNSFGTGQAPILRDHPVHNGPSKVVAWVGPCLFAMSMVFGGFLSKNSKTKSI